MSSINYVKIRELCSSKKVKKEVKSRLNDEDEVSFLPMSDLGEYGYFTSAEQNRSLHEVYKGYTYFEEGDLLIAKITPCFENGKMGIAKNLTNKVGFGSSEYHVLTPNSKILVEYLYYFFYQGFIRERGIAHMTGAVGHKRIPIDFLINQNIPYLSYEKQKLIVSKLDQAFEAIDQAIENTERNIENIKEIFDTSLQKSFNEVNTNEILDSYVEIKTGKLNANAMVKDGKYKFFTCSRETFNIDHFAYDCKAVLLAGNNASGDFNVKYYEGKFNAYQRTYIITIKDESEMCYGYLKYVLNNYLKVFKRMSVGANTRFLKIGMIKNVPLKLPPLNEQKRIAKELDSMNDYLESLKDLSFKKIKAMDELKKSILEKAFKGELI